MGQYRFSFGHGALCLDFCNTIPSFLAPVRTDHLESYDDLVEWGRQGDLLSEEQARRLRKEAGKRPAAAKAVYEKALALRESIFRVFQKPSPADVAVVNAALAEAVSHQRVSVEGGALVRSWEEPGTALDAMLWPVAASAAELLTSDDRKRVRYCASGESCTWLFVDSSKNHSRRWCSMKDCGNRAKARRHYARHRGG